MVEIKELEKKVRDFRDERDWKKYHTPKDLSLSISIEASELLELFQWKDDDLSSVDKERLEEELADVMIYILALSDIADIEIGRAVEKKLKENEERYPPEKEYDF
ncbi:MAG: nucleotide pyrophosphohydrolase [Candidatus Thermoplasmatota archaeon]|nr:nucleotide pyrophosphohydrolase [Candidatus Thermoplasmatota archaeon]